MDQDRDEFKLMRESVAKKLVPESPSQEEALGEFFSPGQRASRSLKEALQPLISFWPEAAAIEGGARAHGAYTAGKDAVTKVTDVVNTATLAANRGKMQAGRDAKLLEDWRKKRHQGPLISDQTNRALGKRPWTYGQDQKAKAKINKYSGRLAQGAYASAQGFSRSKVALGYMGQAIKRGASLVDTLGILGTMPVQAAFYAPILALQQANKAADPVEHLTLMADSKSKVNEKPSPLVAEDFARPAMLVTYLRDNPDRAQKLYSDGILSEDLYRDAIASGGAWEGRLSLEVDDLLGDLAEDDDDDDDAAITEEQIESLQPARLKR